MSKMLKIRKSLGGVIAIAIFSATLAALPTSTMGQEPAEPAPVFPFSTEVLLNFFDANQRISALNRETQERIVSAATEKGMTFERFNQIASATQIGELQAGVFSDAEIGTFNALAPVITGIQREMQSTMQAILLEKELSNEEYQSVLKEFRANQALQEHLRGLLRERARQAAREAREREQQQANPQQ